jgi:DNA-binding CsgD family transcriptional regulator
MEGAPSRLVGREADRAALVAAIDVDRPTLVVGEAGVGKTTLVRAAAALARRRLREGGALALLSWSPYLAIERALGRAIRAGDEVATASLTITSVGPDLLLLDDLQWAHTATLDLLPHLASRVGVVATVRSGSAGSDDAVRAAEAAGFGLQMLTPLGLEARLEMTRSLRPDLPAGRRRAIARASGGNPLFIEELCRAGTTGAMLGTTVRSRLAALSPDAFLAVVLLARAERGLPSEAVGPAATAIREAGFTVDTDMGLGIRHELLGAAAIAACPAGDLADIDRRLARIVDDAGEAARHHLHAGERTLAHEKARQAASEARNPLERAAHLEIAASTADGLEAARLRLDMVEALLDGGDPDQAQAELAPGDGWPPALRARRTVLAARAMQDGGFPRDARLIALAGLDDPAIDPVSEASLRIYLARAASSDPDFLGEAIALSVTAVDRAAAVGTRLGAAQAALALARFRAGEGGWEEGFAAAIAESRRAGDRSAERIAIDDLLFAILRDGRPADGLPLARELEGRGHELEIGAWVLDGRWWQGGLAWHAGRFADSVAQFEALESDDLEDTVGTYDPFYHAQALLDLGRLDESRVRAERFVPGQPPGESHEGRALWLGADLALIAGRWREAHRNARDHAERYPRAQHRPFVAVTEAWSALELGRPSPAARGPSGLRLTEGAFIEIEAIGALRDGRHLAAADRFEEAAATWRGRHARGEYRCRWAEAEALRRAGSPDAARTRLLALEEDLVRVGAGGVLPRVWRSLRHVGVRRAATRGALRPASPLTAREDEILHLIGSGTRDGEIAQRLGVSRWAVTRAVESATAKLGVSNRIEAIARLTR